MATQRHGSGCNVKNVVFGFIASVLEFHQPLLPKLNFTFIVATVFNSLPSLYSLVQDTMCIYMYAVKRNLVLSNTVAIYLVRPVIGCIITHTFVHLRLHQVLPAVITMTC